MMQTNGFLGGGRAKRNFNDFRPFRMSVNGNKPHPPLHEVAHVDYLLLFDLYAPIEKYFPTILPILSIHSLKWSVNSRTAVLGAFHLQVQPPW